MWTGRRSEERRFFIVHFATHHMINQSRTRSSFIRDTLINLDILRCRLPPLPPPLLSPSCPLQHFTWLSSLCSRPRSLSSSPPLAAAGGSWIPR